MSKSRILAPVTICRGEDDAKKNDIERGVSQVEINSGVHEVIIKSRKALANRASKKFYDEIENDYDSAQKYIEFKRSANH